MSKRPEEICTGCGSATGHAGYGEDSIGYLNGAIGPLCDECNEHLRMEVFVDAPIEVQLREHIRTVELENCGLEKRIDRLRLKVQCCERDHNYDGNCDRHPHGLQEEIEQLQKQLEMYKNLFRSALSHVDAVFQKCQENPEPILPNFATLGEDKFAAVRRLAKDYKVRGRLLLEAILRDGLVDERWFREAREAAGGE